MHGQARDGRTLAREAYFLEFAKDIAAVTRMPIMVTGGIRRLPVAEQVLSSGIDMVGIGTAIALNPGLAREWKAGQPSAPMLRPARVRPGRAASRDAVQELEVPPLDEPAIGLKSVGNQAVMQPRGLERGKTRTRPPARLLSAPASPPGRSRSSDGPPCTEGRTS